MRILKKVWHWFVGGHNWSEWQSMVLLEGFQAAKMRYCFKCGASQYRKIPYGKEV